MFSDRIFYPLAALGIAAMVFVALSFGGGDRLSDAQILEQGWELSGPDLSALTVSPGSDAVTIEEDGGYLRLSQFTPYGEGPASVGVFGTLGPDHERVFAGRPLRVTIRARATRDNALERFHSDYYPMEAPAAGWTAFDLGPDWQDYSYEVTPPVVDAAGVDLVALFPGRAGDGKQMDLASIRIDVLPGG